MIVLYRTPECADCDAVEARLQEMVVAHRVELLERGQQTDVLPPGTRLPALSDGTRVAGGPDGVAGFLGELEALIAAWGRFQSDSCYIDDEGCVV